MTITTEQNHEPMNRIRRLSLIMQGVVILGALFAELGLAWVWLSPAIIESFVLPRLELSSADIVLDGRTRLFGFLISSLPLTVVFYALYQAFCLFAGYRRGEIFTVRAAERLRHIALAVVAAVFMSPFVQAALSAALSFGAAPGKRAITMSFSLQDYLVATLGGLLLAIAYVMAEAVRIEKENREII